MAKAASRAIGGCPATCAGGDGSGASSPVVVTAGNSTAGVEAEYRYLEHRYGARGIAWQPVRQRLIGGVNGVYLDVITIRLQDGSEVTLHFDITSFFGKD